MQPIVGLEGRRHSVRSWLRTAVAVAYLLLALAASCGLLGAGGEPFDVIRSFWPHLSVAMVALCLAWTWLLRDGRVLFLLALPALFLVWVATSLPLLPFERPTPPASRERDITVVEFNVLGTNRHRARDIAAFVVDQRPDIAFLLEAPPVRRHMDVLRTHLPYAAQCESETPRPFCDLILMSRHPLREIRHLKLASGHDRLIIAETTIHGQDITLVAVHLTKPLLSGWQRREIAALAPLIASLSRPIIVAGDFNATPWSHAMATFTDGANVDWAYGYIPTWPVWAPKAGIPIDHILTDGGIIARHVNSPEDALGSNHRPVLATFALPGGAPPAPKPAGRRVAPPPPRRFAASVASYPRRQCRRRPSPLPR